MQNVKAEIKGNKLIIEVDVSQQTVDKAVTSKSGKNKLVASTSGFMSVGDGFRIGLNVIK